MPVSAGTAGITGTSPAKTDSSASIPTVVCDALARALGDEMLDLPLRPCRRWCEHIVCQAMERAEQATSSHSFWTLEESQLMGPFLTTTTISRRGRRRRRRRSRTPLNNYTI